MSAEKAAHLSNTLQNAPSIFEVIAQENLAESLRQSLEYLFKALAARRPRNLARTAQYFDEIYLLFDAAVQYHYIRTKGGTLSEAFYDLERLSSSSRNFPKAFLSAVLVPYFQSKILKLIEKLSEENAICQKSWKTKVLYLYNYVQICCDMIKFYYLAMYALGRSRSHSILFSILGLRLTYMNDEVLKDLAGPQRTGLRWFLYALGDGVLPILQIGSFIVQFLQWWRSSSPRNTLTNSLPIPEFYEGNHQLDKSKCPLCFQTRRNNTALSTSGIVFCYVCISKYLKQDQKCPITKIPTQLTHMIRIYE